MVVELNRRLVAGYEHYKDDPRIIHLRQSVQDYNKQLRLLGIRDHQVENVKFSAPEVVGKIIYRSFKLSILALGALPGFIMFLPVFIATKVISVKKAKEALKASTVKIQAKDVIATWKLLVSLGFAPLLYNCYVILFTILTYRHRFYGLIPESVPLIVVPIIGWILFPTITFAALRFGEVGMDIFKSLKPLVLALNPTTTNTLHKLRQRRIELAAEVTKMINTLGPELYPDFDSARVVPTQYYGGKPINTSGVGASNPNSTGSTRPTTPPSGSSSHPHTPRYHPIPKDESFTSLANIGLFASRPTSRGRSRAGSEHWHMSSIDALSSGNAVASGSQVTDGKDFEEVAKRIKGAMEERRQRKAAKRRREGSDGAGEERDVPDGRKTTKDGWIVESESEEEEEEVEEKKVV
jgi:glycerol-3-phosphate O-acyltransferase / dihydroxyacetone phosphate acyltransferase